MAYRARAGARQEKIAASRGAARDLIAAAATPAATGGIGIVRASGAGIERLARMLSGGRMPAPRVAARRRFLDADGEIIDDGLALFFAAPASFTGEDVLELHGHGGLFVMQRLLARCLQLGARLAEPGEFSLRAYLNDKMDLAQAEALCDLINAGGAAAARAAARTMAGEWSEEVAAAAAQVRAARVALESDLDFSDEDAMTPDAGASAAALAEVAAALEALLRRARSGARLAAGADIVIAGAPNAGKSSLLNFLAGEDAAIVSPAPGTTRDAIERQVVIDGLAARITDTAGLRDGADEVEAEGMRRARARLADADLVVCLSAADAPAPPLMQDWLAESAAPLLQVKNKIDLSGEAPGYANGVHYLSAKTGAGMADFVVALRAAAGYLPEADAPAARARHVAALVAARDYAQKAQASAGELPEVAAAWLGEAHTQLQTITGGAYDEEALLGDIFSSFCIGK